MSLKLLSRIFILSLILFIKEQCQAIAGEPQMVFVNDFLNTFKNGATSPAGIALNDKNIYVANLFSGSVSVFNYQGKRVSNFGGFVQPVGVALADSSIYVTDSLDNKVVVLNQKGKQRFSFQATPGGFDNKLSLPRGIAFINGLIYVGDAGNQRVAVFNKKGKFKFNFKRTQVKNSSGDFVNNPQGNTLTSCEGITAVGKLIYVTDPSNDRVCVFNSTGNFLGNFTLTPNGLTPFLTDPEGITSLGNFVVVADAQDHRIALFTSLGKFLEDLRDTPNAKFGQTLNAPFGAAAIGNFFYITDIATGRIVVFQLKQNFERLVKTGNPHSVAQYLDKLQNQQTPSANAADPDLGHILVTLFGLTTNSELRDALDQLHVSNSQDLSWLGAENYRVIFLFLMNELQNRRFLGEQNLEDVTLAFSSAPKEQINQFFQLAAQVPQTFKQVTQRFKQAASRSKASRSLSLTPDKSALPPQLRVQGKASQFWIQHLTQDYKANKQPGTPGIHADTYGFAAGFDYKICKDFILGLLVGDSFSDFKWKKNHDKGHLNTCYTGLYSSWGHDEGLYIDAAALGGHTRNKSKRQISFDSLNRKAAQHHTAKEFSATAEVGYDYKMCLLDFQPFINETYTWIKNAKYTETGAGVLNLHVNEHKSAFLRTEAGGALSWLYGSEGTYMRPMLRVSYVHNQNVQGKSIVSGFAGLPGTFTVKGDHKARNLVAASASLTTLFCNGISVTATYAGEFNNHVKSNAGLIQLGYQF